MYIPVPNLTTGNKFIKLCRVTRYVNQQGIRADSFCLYRNSVLIGHDRVRHNSVTGDGIHPAVL